MLRVLTTLTSFRAWPNRAIRAMGWLCLVLMAGLTVLLFTTTGGAVSSQFRSGAAFLPALLEDRKPKVIAKVCLYEQVRPLLCDIQNQ